jgi:membrane protease YdiL (CAAX protease family)
MIRKSKPFGKLFLIFVVIFISYFLLLFFGLITASFIFGYGIKELFEQLKNISAPGNENLLYFFQATQALSIFVIPPIVIAFVFSKKPLSFLYLDKPVDYRTILMVISLMIILQYGILLIQAMNYELLNNGIFGTFEDWANSKEEGVCENLKAFFRIGGIEGIAFNLLIIAVLPAIGEELLFRGILQKIFVGITDNIHIGILITGFLFSLMHVQFIGFFPRMLMGVVFGYLLYWTGSIWIPILAHFVNNALGVITIYYIDSLDQICDHESAPDFYEIWFPGLISLLLSYGIMYFIFRKSKAIL